MDLKTAEKEFHIHVIQLQNLTTVTFSSAQLHRISSISLLSNT